MLIVARFIQGIAGAGAVSAIVAIIAAEFPQPRERATAMSIYTLVVSGGASMGLIAGGVITETLSWHWIFFINVPLGIFRCCSAAVGSPRTWARDRARPGRARGPSSSLRAIMVGAYAIVTAGDAWLGSAHTRARRRWRCSSRSSRASRGCASRSCRCIFGSRAGLFELIRGLLVTGMFASFFLGVLYLERVRGYGALSRAGLPAPDAPLRGPPLGPTA